MTDSHLISRLEAAQNRNADIELLRKAIGHESVTGNEANFASFLMSEMTDMGLQPSSGDFLPGRPNIWCARSGLGAGPNLMFIGHTDTVHVRGWSENWKGHVLENPFAAPMIDGEIWGRGACDLKAGICSPAPILLASLEFQRRHRA